VLRAVLFDWNNTLARFEWDDDLLAEGHRAGLAAIGRDGAEELTRRFREVELAPGSDYRETLRSLLGALLGGATDADLDRFVDAEFAAWEPARALASTTHALLEALRRRGLKLAVVANAWPEPARLLRGELERLGVAERIDAAVFSDEAGARKPDPVIFQRVLSELGTAAEEALHVGDRLLEDVGGAAALGMRTVQALWFSADDAEGAPEPDFQAFTQMDVLNIVDRLAAGDLAR
jgi:HAD superfamily hydrolase (TIGR01509 family)